MRASHILGLNSRNHLYLSRYNSRRGRQIADSKYLTKKLLRRHKLPHPRLLAYFDSAEALSKFNWDNLAENFVIKPAAGYAGEGIILVKKRLGKTFQKTQNTQSPGKSEKSENQKVRNSDSPTFRRSGYPSLPSFPKENPPDDNSKYQLMDGSAVTLDDLKLHILDILAGRFDKYDLPGAAMVEERVKKHHRFKRYAYQGTPDVRVIVFNKVPVMAMLRLPTPQSRGRANLHQGAVGVGVDLATGITTHAVHWDRPIRAIPLQKSLKMDNLDVLELDNLKSRRLDQGIKKSRIQDQEPPSSNFKKSTLSLKLNGLRLPWWDQILELSISAQTIVPLGYMAVDFLLDPDKGPLIIELTARPGLSIQLANQAGLERRLERVEGLDILPGKGIEVAKALFAERFSDKVIAERGQKIVAVFETAKLRAADGEKHEIPAKIDTGAFRSSIDRQLAADLGLLGPRSVLWHDTYVSSLGRQQRPIIPLTFWLAGRKIDTAANVSDRAKLPQKLLVGRRDLGTFVIKINGQ
jgi:hypothetical protein